MPSVMSWEKSVTIGSGMSISNPGPRYAYCWGSSSYTYRPVATMILTGVCAAIRWIRGM